MLVKVSVLSGIEVSALKIPSRIKRFNEFLDSNFTVDFLTKKRKVNEGEVPQYLVKNSHPAIIEPEIFDLVQFEMKRRQQTGGYSTGAHPFSGKIFCGDCGGLYGSKMWPRYDKQHYRALWQCNEKQKRGGDHHAPHLSDGQIQAAFLAAFNSRLENKAEIFAAYDEVLKVLTDTSDLDAEAAELQGEREVVAELTRKCVKENAKAPLKQEEYEQRYNAPVARYDAATARLQEVEARRLERGAKRTNLTRFLKALVKRGDDLVTEFDEELWYITVDTITAYADGRLVVRFRDGAEVVIAAEVWTAA
jgi:hypothetical protein